MAEELVRLGRFMKTQGEWIHKNDSALSVDYDGVR